MNTNARLTLFKVFLVILVSTLLLVIVPYYQMGRPSLHEDTESGDLVPRPLSGLAARGSHVYQENACGTCHTQQARNLSSSDKIQGYSKRNAVARDFAHQPSVSFAGWNRLGPDLSNVGDRQKSVDWHYQHLYLPESVSPGSIMPSYAFLFEKRKIVGQPSQDALKLPASYPLEEGYEVVPRADAKALVAYLLSLKQDYSLPEARIIEE